MDEWESMNLQFDHALLRHDMSHIDVIDTSSIAREDYTMHDLHLNSRGKKKLMQLIWNRIIILCK
jgi:hypothetical protein